LPTSAFLVSDRRTRLLVRFRFIWAVVTALSGFAIALGQTANPPTLPLQLGDSWKAVGEARFPTGDAVQVEYGLRKIVVREYTNGKTKYAVELFAMNFTSGAYGLLTFNQAAIGANQKAFQHGRYLIRITGAAPIVEPDPVLSAALRAHLPDSEIGEQTSLPDHLPATGLIPGSQRYVLGPLALAQTKGFGELKDVVPFTGGAEAIAASYANGAGQLELLIVEYHTPQLATDGYAALQAQFAALPPDEQQRRLLRRIGNYAVEAVNVQDPAAAQSLVGQIKYTQRVYWEGRKLSDIPLEYRPPDAAAIEEASQTANVLIRTFYWIGIMMTSALILGLVAGGSFFYVKRYLRRKRGLDNLFSDAGGTVRLDLDEYQLQPSPEPIKQIGKQEEKE
jgi:hypothetical protein